jgi:hypothetical protein
MEYFEKLEKLDLDDIESLENIRDEILDFVESATAILQVLNNRIDEKINKKKEIELSEYTDKKSDYE